MIWDHHKGKCTEASNQEEIAHEVGGEVEAKQEFYHATS